MKQSEQRKEFRGKSQEQLETLVSEKEDELMKLRFKQATTQLEQTGQLKQIRRSIARAKTIINEQKSQA